MRPRRSAPRRWCSPTSTASEHPTSRAPRAWSPACVTRPTREEILLAAYEGAAASLIEALDELARQGSGLDPDAPLILIGGGARGAVWQRVVARLSGRRVLVPEADELVALGAAAQAAACLAGEPAAEVARRWDTRSGITVEPPAEPDEETLARIRSVRRRRWSYIGTSDLRRPHYGARRR